MPPRFGFGSICTDPDLHLFLGFSPIFLKIITYGTVPYVHLHQSLRLTWRPVLRIRIRRIRMFLGLLDPEVGKNLVAYFYLLFMTQISQNHLNKTKYLNHLTNN